MINRLALLCLLCFYFAQCVTSFGHQQLDENYFDVGHMLYPITYEPQAGKDYTHELRRFQAQQPFAGDKVANSNRKPGPEERPLFDVGHMLYPVTHQPQVGQVYFHEFRRIDSPQPTAREGYINSRRSLDNVERPIFDVGHILYPSAYEPQVGKDHTHELRFINSQQPSPEEGGAKPRGDFNMEQSAADLWYMAIQPLTEESHALDSWPQSISEEKYPAREQTLNDPSLGRDLGLNAQQIQRVNQEATNFHSNHAPNHPGEVYLSNVELFPHQDQLLYVSVASMQLNPAPGLLTLAAESNVRSNQARAIFESVGNYLQLQPRATVCHDKIGGKGCTPASAVNPQSARDSKRLRYGDRHAGTVSKVMGPPPNGGHRVELHLLITIFDHNSPYASPLWIRQFQTHNGGQYNDMALGLERDIYKNANAPNTGGPGGVAKRPQQEGWVYRTISWNVV